MKNIFRIIPLGMLTISLFCGKIQAQNVQVAGAVTGNGFYPTVEAAFTAINSGAQTGATISVTIVGNTTETASAVLNTGDWTTLTISPTGARTVTGSIAGALIDINGADRVALNGLNSGGNSLTISNTSTGSVSTLRFQNDADHNVVSNVTLLGAGTSTTNGTVMIGGGTATGNDSIVFSACTISSGVGTEAVNAVYAAGTAGMDNNVINFTGCRISDYFSATQASCGINVGANNSNWTINSGRFFQTSARTYTTGNTHRAINIGSGSGHTIIFTTIGYASASNTGTYTMAGTVATRFIAIDLAVGTASTTNVTDNLINAFSLATSSGAATTNGIWCAVNITSGNVTCSANTIGAGSGTGLISCTPTTSQGSVVGFHTSSTGAISFLNNSFGAMVSAGATAAVAGGCFGINVSAAAATLTITGNTIGNTTADNMRAGTAGFTTSASLCAGINITTNPTGAVNISNNTIRNMSSYGTGSGYVRGIATPLTTSSTATYTVSQNTITNLTTSGSLTGMTSGQVSAAGIQFFAAGGSTISNNTISNISNINTGTGNMVVAGITLAATSVTVGDNTISGNQIYGLQNAGTGTTATSPPIVAGIGVRSGANNQYNIQNNMISLGSGQTTNTCFVGVWGNHGSTPNPTGVNIRYNTINIEGTVTAGALPTCGIHRGDFTATTRTITTDIRNNIVTNTRTGGTGAHYAIGNNINATSSAIGWSSNNNVLNADAATVGHWTTAQNFAGWQTNSVSDAASWSGITVTYVNSATNLHLNMGTTPTVIESGAQTIAAVSTDIDAQVRPGPAGSVNGGAFMPDIGADEFDGVPLDLLDPTIAYTPLGVTCLTTDRTITANIADLTGVPTAGTLQPRIYFRKNAGPWFSTQGTLISGNSTSGTWNFTISSAAMGGLVALDDVEYFVIAQDLASTPNVGSNPGAGLVASDVNTVTTAPTTPAGYTIGDILSGTYTVGAGGDFATITDAVNMYNISCVSGTVVFELTDLLYSASETFPIVINANPSASAVNTLTIKPQLPGTVITGSAATIFRFSGADYVTIDGSVASTANSSCSPVVASNRDLSIVNSSTTALSSVIWIESLGTGAGATRNTIKNCNISAGVDLSTSTTETYAVVSCGSTVTAFPPSDGLDNNYNTFENNGVVRATWGIYLRGGASSSNRGNVISQNTVGPAAFGSNQIRKGGIIIQNQDSAMIIANEVRFVGNQVSQTAGGTDHIGIGVGGADGPTPGATNVTNTMVMRNNVHDIVCEKTFSAIGILLAVNNASPSNNVIANNMVNAVRTNGTSPDQGIGINVVNGNTDMIVFNTVNMVTADRDPASATTASQSDICYRFQAGAINPSFQNNIGYIDAASNTATLMNFVVVAPSVSYVWGISNHNDYAINTAGTQNVLFGLGTTGTIPPVNTLAAWQGTFTPPQDANSITVVPVFESSTDLHLVPGSNPTLENLGVPIAGYPADYDCATRNITTPDMGADEACNLADVPVVTATPTAVCVGDTATLTITSGSLNESASWEWYESACGTNAQGSGTSITVAPTVTSDYYVRAEGGCSVNTSCVMITVQVNALPTVIAAGTDTVCYSEMVTLSGSGAVSYSWSGPQVITDNVPFAATVTGIYTVTGTDANGCEDTDDAYVQVDPLPTVTASPQADTVCAGGLVTLAGGGATSYSWNGPETITDNVAFAPTVSGTYTVTGTDGNGCMDTATAMVTVNALPAVGASPSTATVCAGSQVTFAGSGASSYNWSGPEPVTDNVPFTPVANATYTVTGTDVNGCEDTATATVVVNPLPMVMYAEPVDTACQTTTVSFNLSGESPAGGTWSGPGVSGNMFDPMAANIGYNVVTYLYTDSVTGCANMAMDSVWVDLCLTVAAVSGDAGVSAYPNPNNGVFTVAVNAAHAELTIEIMSVEGKVVFSNQHTNVNAGNVEQIDMAGFANGTYFVKVTADQQVSVIKVVKSE